MTKIPHILTEETEKNLFQKNLLPHLLLGENVTARWTPHGGRRKALTFLAQFGRSFGFSLLGKFLLVYVDKEELTEETPRAYCRLFLNSLTGKKNVEEGSPDFFSLLKEKIDELLAQNYHLIFILGRFDELNLPTILFDNLKHLWQLDKAKVHFIFAVNRNIFHPDLFIKYGQLRELLSQNLVYFPIFSRPDDQFLVEYFIKKYGYKVSQTKQTLVKKLGGGHPSLTKACLRILNDSPLLSVKEIQEFLSQQWEIKMILEDIWRSLEPTEKNALLEIVQDTLPKNAKIPEAIDKLRIITKTKEGQFEFFSPLFRDFVASQKLDAPEITLDPQSGEILINGFPTKEKITLQEYHLLTAFLKKPDTVLNRDRIAEVLWDKEADEKYSDWAIDQIISQLRNKLERLGISGQKLQTIRGRGYRWIN